MEKGRSAWKFLSGNESVGSGVNPDGVVIGLFIHISVLPFLGTW